MAFLIIFVLVIVTEAVLENKFLFEDSIFEKMLIAPELRSRFAVILENKDYTYILDYSIINGVDIFDITDSTPLLAKELELKFLEKNSQRFSILVEQ